MSHHSLEFREGLSAFDHGQSLIHNPYEAGTREHEDWAEGWTRAREDADADEVRHEKDSRDE